MGLVARLGIGGLPMCNLEEPRGLCSTCLFGSFLFVLGVVFQKFCLLLPSGCFYVFLLLCFFFRGALLSLFSALLLGVFFHEEEIELKSPSLRHTKAFGKKR